MEHSFSFRGLYITGTVEHDAGQPFPTYDCGGVPPSTDLEIDSVEMDDPEEFAEHELGEEFSEEAVLRIWGDDILEMLSEQKMD
jgi:hypothetical protein